MKDEDIAARMILKPSKNGGCGAFHLGKCPPEMFSCVENWRRYNNRTSRVYRWAKNIDYDIRIDNKRYKVSLLVALAMQKSGPSLARNCCLMQQFL